MDGRVSLGLGYMAVEKGNSDITKEVSLALTWITSISKVFTFREINNIIAKSEKKHLTGPTLVALQFKEAYSTYYRET